MSQQPLTLVQLNDDQTGTYANILAATEALEGVSYLKEILFSIDGTNLGPVPLRSEAHYRQLAGLYPGHTFTFYVQGSLEDDVPPETYVRLVGMREARPLRCGMSYLDLLRRGFGPQLEFSKGPNGPWRKQLKIEER